MARQIFILLLALPLLMFGDSFSSLSLPPSSQLGQNAAKELVINNRILVRVNGKAISLLDVIKQMDVHLEDYYPQMLESKEGRYQFYTAKWREFLDEMISSELMMADAESREIKVTDGEIREAIQERFGPNVRTSLDKIGLSYEEAKTLIHREKIVERMRWFRVFSKALNHVTAQEVKKGYQTYCVDHPPKNIWKYQILSVRSQEKEKSEKAAAKAYTLIQKGEEKLDNLIPSIQEEFQDINITLSQEYEFEDKLLSDANKVVLSSITEGQVTPPVVQPSREGFAIYRLFYLKSHVQEEPPKFETIAGRIKEELIQQAVEKEFAVYLSKIRNRFGCTETSKDIPSDYKPFVLK